MKPDHVIPSRPLPSAGYRHLVLQCLRPCGAAGPAPPPPQVHGRRPPPPRDRPGVAEVGRIRGRVEGPNGEVWGFTKLGEIPGTPWRIRDDKRPQPPVVAPGDAPGAPPADAIVLFDGKDLSKWVHRVKDTVTDAQWLVHDGIFESGRGSSLSTRESFGDCQLHVEFATPDEGRRRRARAAATAACCIMGRYEIQVLDCYENQTYSDGQAAAIYRQHAADGERRRKPGEWQTYDIVFEAPRFEDGRARRRRRTARCCTTASWCRTTSSCMGGDVCDGPPSTRRTPRGSRSAAGPRQPGPLPQHLGPPAEGIRSGGVASRRVGGSAGRLVG